MTEVLKNNKVKVLFLILSVLLTVTFTSMPVLATSNSANNVQATDKDSIRVKPYSTKPVQFNVYTYENAPSDVKAQYEADVKAVNGKVSPSDEILVPITDVNTNSAKASPQSTVTATVVDVYRDSSGNVTAVLRYYHDGYTWYVYPSC